MPPLLSGNGRHRRPRQAPNFVVAAGVTGAGLAIPLLGATSASAADNPTWDAVAECESGGLWSADEDNGYYGGLQLDQETWESYGGTEYAERPDLASRDQQISVAESILDEEGAGTFGECAESAGLSQESPGEPDVDPDGSEEVADGPVAERPYPPYPSENAPEEEGGASEGEGSADPSESPDPSESGDSGDGSSDSGDGSSDSPASPDSPDATAPSVPEGSGDESTGSGEEDEGRGDGSYEPSDPAFPGTGDGADNSGDSAGDGTDGHPSRGGADGRDDDADQDTGDGDGDGSGGSAAEHLVTGGDSLSGIAEEEDVKGGWQELYERNRDVVGSDPDLILPGQELRL